MVRHNHRGWYDTSATAFSRVPPEGLFKKAEKGRELRIYEVKYFFFKFYWPQTMCKRLQIDYSLHLYQETAIKSRLQKTRPIFVSI